VWSLISSSISDEGPGPGDMNRAVHLAYSNKF
jgi:hypothetical protein